MPALEERWSMELCGGRLQTFCWEADERGERLIRVWSPAGWERGQAVKSLWLNDGQNLFRDEDAFGGASWGAAGSVAHLVATGSVPPMVVFGIDHRGPLRTYDYLSAPPTGWDAPWGKGMRGDMWDAPGGGVEEYVRRVMLELLPWAQERFGLTAEPKDRFFGGSSFGGICALYMAMQFPGEWQGILVESPSFWAGEGRYMRDVAAASAWPKRMYLAMGELEYTGFRGTERPGSLQCDAFLREACVECAGHLRTELFSFVELGGKHNERDWGRRLPGALRWLLGEASVVSEAFWTRPCPVQPGQPWELFLDKDRVTLPERGRLEVQVGFDHWSTVQRLQLLPSGLDSDGRIWAQMAVAPRASCLHFAITNGVEWDNNGEKNYELEMAKPS